jgi:FtsP/CotA-like multicopper oxidase with cupredoxin domain
VAAGAAGALGLRSAPARATARTLAASPAPLRADVYTHLAGTDGWISLPPQNSIWHPDNLAPDPFNTYVFGFADATPYINPATGSAAGTAGLAALKNQAQIDAPLLGYDEGKKVQISLTNVGLKQRPDLTDGHTIHWHGFKNAIPLFDGVPEMSVATPVGRTFAFFYNLERGTAGTYMYHCHWEDVEHVQMGMRGMVYVRPMQNTATAKFAYNDGDGSTQYDREFSFMLTDMWLQSHWEDAHIQQPDWSEFTPDAYLLNGRSYPDTVLPRSGDPAMDPADAARLKYQPYSSLVRCNSGDRVLIRMSNLGYTTPSMTMDGLRLKVVGRDASWLRGHYVDTHTLRLGPGESADAIFVAPNVSSMTSFDFANRNYSAATSGATPGLGGQTTRVEVYPAGTLAPQGGINR